MFFMLRSLSLQLRGQPETQLPLTREEDLIKTDDVLDLSELVTPRHGGGGGGHHQAGSRVARRVMCDLHVVLGLIRDRELTECACHTKLSKKGP